MKKAMKRRDRESGQSLVEFALVVPLLFLLLFGSIEFGRVFHAYHVITSAAREGARAAAVGKSNTDIETKIEGAVSSLVSDTSKVNIKLNATYENPVTGKPPEGEIYFTVYPYDARLPDSSVDVKVKGVLRIIVPLISSFFSENPKIIEGKAQMRME